MRHSFKSKAGQAHNIDVPGEILDIVASYAPEYVEKSRERLLGGFPEEEHEKILKQSTHNVVNTPERRQLHREILQELAQNLKGEPQEKPIFLYFVGPMAAGKTGLRNSFEQRMESEEKGLSKGIYEEPELETVYQKYKTASSYVMEPNFSLFKEKLPEFKESGGNYAVIRAEAAALAQAVYKWSKDLGVNVIEENLGDGAPKDWAQEKAQMYDWTSIGVTSNPVTNRLGLEERSAATGQTMTTDEEFIRTVQGFSANNVLGLSPQAVLLSADDGYKVIASWDNGQKQVHDQKLYETFESYKTYSVEDLRKDLSAQKQGPSADAPDFNA